MSTFPISTAGSIDLEALAAALEPIFDTRYLNQPTPAPTPTPTPTPSPAASWVYHNGVFVWAGDYSWNTGQIDYAAPGGLAGGPCIGVPITGQWGGWQPYAAGKKFDTTPFKYLFFATKPTQPNQIHGIGFEAINDVPDGSFVNLGGKYGVGTYGPIPQVGVWGRYKIPLADFKLTNVLIQKFCITDGTGDPTNLFYVDEVGFSP